MMGDLPSFAAILAFALVIIWPALYRRRRQRTRPPRIIITVNMIRPPRKD